MRFAKLIVRAGAALLGLGALPALAQEDAATQPVRPAKVHVVSETDGSIALTYPAIVLPSTEAELSFRVSGRVIELPVVASDQVAEGDLIAQIDPRDFESQVAQLESQVDQSEAQLAALRAGAREEEVAALEAAVAAAQAQVDQAREQAERTRQLAERGVVSEAQLEQDDATLRVAEANLESQQEQLTIGISGGRAEDIAAAEAAIRALEAQLKVARDNLADTRLTAPFSGIIARRYIDNFTNVQAGQSVVLLQNVSTVHMAFDIPGPDVTRLSQAGFDDIVNTVTFDGLPGETFSGRAVEFALQADMGTQTYRGRIAVDAPQGTLMLPGMVGRVIINKTSEDARIMIPLASLASRPDGAPFVWLVAADNTVSARDIALGEMSGDHIVVSEGLAAGDTIVAAGVSQVLEGMEIRPVTQIGG